MLYARIAACEYAEGNARTAAEEGMRSVRADCYVTYQIRSLRSANIRVSRG
jgi:hypothetical protein